MNKRKETETGQPLVHERVTEKKPAVLINKVFKVLHHRLITGKLVRDLTKHDAGI